MKEYYTEALVLDEDDSNEFDKLIYLYTEELGKVVAKAKSSRKITSKLAGHLQPLNFVAVRLVEEHGFQAISALETKRMVSSRESLQLLRFIKDMTFELQPDKKLWMMIKKSFRDLEENKFSYKPLLASLGFALDFAECGSCANPKILYFSKQEQMFLCGKCAASSSNHSSDDLVGV